ncbi:DnaJ like subfamily B member 12 [Blastomyces silverae]|uniref:DnaJ like subfamily B member 12 n=1 Tax=Blastomyces silverae TaxID=2060906 RepID=A0A0H1BAM1_9EURO|nr:DnaJ like subfamily B member 12 [Blastomyces silverae]
MSSATASGADAKPNGSAKSREHNQGNQDRKFTPEQKAAVLRVRKCPPTAFYEILALEKTASDGEIKKAYRRLSLLTHPDKNGYDGSDEAFKMVSRAFQILSDSEKKSKYDKFGGDPDNRFSPGASSSSSPFSGFSGFPQGGGRGPMFDEEISPEELFNRFFGGGGFGPFGGGMFDTGPQFVFNMGGGPNIRVHQFGGSRTRRRPREADNRSGGQDPPAGIASFAQFIPILLIFLLPLLTSLFSGSTSSGPSLRYDRAVPPHTMHRTTPKLKLDYFINPAEVEDYSARKFYQLDQKVEVDYVSNLRYDCEREIQTRDQMIQDAQGWFFPDVEKLKEARSLELRSCKRLNSLKL